MTTSLYWSMGSTDAGEWACVLCGHGIQNDWVEQWICTKFCVKLEHFSDGNYLDDSEGFWGWCNECSTSKSVAQMLQRWLSMCWKWPMFWKACNKQNTWEYWTCMGCSQQRLATDSARTRSWGGDSKHYWVRDFVTGSRYEMCCGKFCSTASATRAEGTSFCSC